MKKINIRQFSVMSRTLLIVFLSMAVAALLWQTPDDFYDGAILKANAAETAEGREQTKEIADSPIFTEFNVWAKQYLNGASSVESLRKGKRLVAERRELLKRLIQTGPQAALERAVSEEIYNRLPAEITRHLEKRVSGKGDFIVHVFDEIESEYNKEAVHRMTREVIFGEAKYKAFVYGRKAAMTTKLEAPLGGIVLDDVMAVDENSVRKIETAEYATRNVDQAKPGAEEIIAEVGGEIVYFSNQQKFDEYAKDLAAWEAKISPLSSDSKDSTNSLSPWTEGVKRVLVIRVDFPDRIGEPTDQSGAPLTETRAQNVINNAVNPFFVSNSYGKTSLQNPVVTPVVRMPQPQSFYNGFNLNTVMLTDARAAARAAGFETNNFDLDIIAFGFTPNLSFSGSAIIGGKGLFLNGFFDFKTIAHELGHNYGLLHANLWRTTDGTVAGNGANVEYGDAFDLMGGGASQSTHFSAGYKRRLDWLTDQNVQTVSASGTYRIFAYDAVNAPTGIHALKIKKDNSKDYWIEFRQLFPNVPALANGALVRWDFAQQSLRQTQLLDMTPNTASLADAPLLVGGSFVDNAIGVTISVLGKGSTVPESLDIRVDINYSIIKGAPFDFDGDNKSDIAVFRPEIGAWYLNQSTQGFRALQWGLSTDKIVPAKFNADRTTDIAVFRPETGVWHVYNSTGGSPIIVQFGQAGDIPVPADYDGDGFSEMAVYRPSNGTWYMWNWAFQRVSAVQFGISTDKPVPADYDRDGKIDVAVYRPETGVWYLLRSSQGFTAFQFGRSEDKPVVGDYDGDARSDFAVYRPSNGVWYIQGSTNGFYGVQFGIETDQPAPGDFDGDGKIDIAVFRSQTGVWYIQGSTAGFYGTQFGVSTDKPASAAFVF